MNTRNKIEQSLESYHVAILPPMDVFASCKIMKESGIRTECVMLDPWYNKGFGGQLPEQQYDEFIHDLLGEAAQIGELIYLWGFPEVIGPYVRYAPEGFTMSAWLTWYYKNCPSVIRGWRSSQNACLQFTSETKKLHPENFLNETQLAKYKAGKMRFIPGPPSVIEEPLIIGFVGKKEKTGHPSQKPESVFERLLLMAMTDSDYVFDPMAGSGTTAAVAVKHGFNAIVCDQNEEYIQMIEKRLGIPRIQL